MASNFWHVYKHAGNLMVTDERGEGCLVQLCRDRRGRLGIVREGEEFTARAGHLTADFGPVDATGHAPGFASIQDAERYLNRK